MTRDLELIGLADLQADVSRLETRRVRELDDAAEAGAEHVRDAVARRAGRHRASGRMARQVKVIARADGLAVHASGRVAHLITGGTAPHTIRSHGRALELRSAGGGLRGFAEVVHHPGTRADPFVARGLEDALPDVDRELEHAGDRILLSLSDGGQ